MSTYYDFYIFKKTHDENKLEYIGPYTKDGKIASILCRSQSYMNDILEESDSQQIDEDVFSEYGLDEYFPINKDDLFKRTGYLIPMKNLPNIKDTTYRKGYVHHHIIRDIEVGHHDIDLNEIYYEDYDDRPSIISTTEYMNLDKEEKKKYLFYQWKNDESASYLRDILVNIIQEWVDIHHYLVEYEDIVIFVEV